MDASSRALVSQAPGPGQGTGQGRRGSSVGVTDTPTPSSSAKAVVAVGAKKDEDYTYTSTTNTTGVSAGAGKLRDGLLQIGEFRIYPAAVPKIQEMLETSAKRLKRSSTMQMVLASFNQYFTANRHLEMTHLMYAEQRSPSWDELFRIKQRRLAVRTTSSILTPRMRMGVWSPTR